jgi:VIT1/CCC1 family predicted Fe2+/Mn2+ transporter
LTVGLSYFAGATVPVLGYLFVPPREGIVISVVATVATLFVVGAAKTIITARPWWRSGLESMATGIVAAAVTYGAGRFFAGR